MSRSRPERRLARLQRASLDKLLSELRVSEKLANHSPNSRSTALFRYIAVLLEGMVASARPSFNELYSSLPPRYRGLINEAQCRQAGITVDEPPRPPQPNTSWDEFESWTEMSEVTLMTEMTPLTTTQEADYD